MIDFLFKKFKGYTMRLIFLFLITGLSYMVFTNSTFLSLHEYISLNSCFNFIENNGKIYFSIFFVCSFACHSIFLIIRKTIKVFTLNNLSKVDVDVNINVNIKKCISLNTNGLYLIEQINAPLLEENDNENNHKRTPRQDLQIISMGQTYSGLLIIVSILCAFIFSFWILILTVFMMYSFYESFKVQKHCILAYHNKENIKESLKI